MTEPTLEESVQQILPTLPAPIQRFFQQKKLGEVTRTLMERYVLHVDQGAILGQELMLALLGVKGPDEVAEELYDKLPVSAQTVKNIIDDLNAEVFEPIRAEMEKGGTIESELPNPKGGSANLLASTYAPRASRPPQPSPRPISGPTVAPLPPKIVMPRPFIASSEVGPRPPRIESPTLPDANKLLEDHEEPHIEFSKVAPVMPTQARTIPPPANLPGAMPPVPPKPYSVDPYHESIDGK